MRKLLLADDSVTIQKVVTLTFADEGMQVATVSNGAQAIKRLEEEPPDIVLADVFMPERNGYEVCEYIKRSEKFQHIPVILLVGSFEPFDEVEARRVGADDYLTKPFQSIRQLVNKVGKLLGDDTPAGEATTQELTMPAEAAQSSSETPVKELDLFTADTAPLSQQQMLDQAEPQPPASRSIYADDHFDDEMIEATPASQFSAGSSQASEPQPPPEVSYDAADFMADTIINSEPSTDQMQAIPQTFSQEEMNENTASLPQAATAQMFDATLADETLLDLGDIDSAPAPIEADEHILDLQYEVYQRPIAKPGDGMDTATLASYEDEMAEAAPQAGEFVEAQIAGAEQRAEFAAVADEEQHASIAQAQVTGGKAAPGRDRAAGGATSQPATGQINLDQLSPEVIDAIARRAVEHLSERVVQEIAWEVVPQLAELLIKRRLEEERSQPR